MLNFIFKVLLWLFLYRAIFYVAIGKELFYVTQKKCLREKIFCSQDGMISVWVRELVKNNLHVWL